ncbi:MAG: hypothetical protein ACYC6A_03105 [Armatimonadota bacterium]
MSICRKSTRSPNSAAARLARSKVMFCAGHQPPRKAVTVTLPGAGAGCLRGLIHFGGCPAAVLRR